VGKHTADIVQFGGGYGILRSHHLDVVGDARLVTLSRQPEVLFVHFAISLRDLNLSGGRLQVQKRIPNFALDAADRIFDLSLALYECGVRLLDFSFRPTSLPDRDAKRSGDRKRAVRLSRVRSDHTIIGAECDRGQPFGPRGGPRALCGADLRPCGLQIRPLIEGLFEHVLKTDRRRGRERNTVGEFASISGRDPSEASEVYLLLRQIVLQGNEVLLLSKRLYLASVNVDLRHKPSGTLLRGLFQ